MTLNTLQPPYGDPTGFTDHWWHSRLLTDEHSHWWSVTDESGSDVARVEVDSVSTIGSTYCVDAPADGFVEIALVEVRKDRRAEAASASRQFTC
jgi:hypothetical protein